MSAAIDSLNRERAAANLEGNDNDETKHKKAKDQVLDEVKNNMDSHFNWWCEQLHHHAGNHNTDALWRTIAKCIERGIVDTLNLDNRTKDTYYGHGKPFIKPTIVQTNMEETAKYTDPDAANASLAEHATQMGQDAKRCHLQAARMQQVLNRLKRQAAGYPVRTHRRFPPACHCHSRQA